MNRSVDLMNKMIRGNVTCCGYSNVYFVDPAPRFKGHEWGAKEQWLQRGPECEAVPDWSHEPNNRLR